ELKKEAEEVLSELGLSISAATTVFLKQVVRSRGIPFELKLENYNGKKEEEQKID
ncbi:MAG: type II toxin-antitoxin system RelB/DinJ family antitoxin, partial [Lachnospiraceae bacterium]|nr:type II toxin-antitoxin system RelB/DinJ family antitoxin [Lachnospiraceae bacterium]